jgi:hypothetical protein
MDLRASPSAAERGTWARPLRRAILARPSPPCTHDDARLRLPATQSPQKSEMGKKESTDRRLNQACRPSVTPSSRSSLECRRSDARTATNGYVQTCSLNESAKVVLGHRAKIISNRNRRGAVHRFPASPRPCRRSRFGHCRAYRPGRQAPGISRSALQSGGQAVCRGTARAPRLPP